MCQLSVPRTGTSYGDRSFAAYGPSIRGTVYLALQLTDVSIQRHSEHTEDISV